MQTLGSLPGLRANSGLRQDLKPGRLNSELVS